MVEAPPTVIVLGGPNGAGKTTSARTVLAETLQLMTYVNADVIAQGLSGFDPEGAAVEAGRIMLHRLDELAERRTSFAFESTLAGRALVKRLRDLRRSGYRMHLVYIWVSSADLAVARVAERVRVGGHAVPEATIRQRYGRSLRNFFQLYRPLADSWEVYDNSSVDQPRLVAAAERGGRITVRDEAVWASLQQEPQS